MYRVDDEFVLVFFEVEGFFIRARISGFRDRYDRSFFVVVCLAIFFWVGGGFGFSR